MSKWTDFRDEVVEALHIEEVTEDTKQKFTVWLLETIKPLADTAAASFVAQVKAQAVNEKGWLKVRDMFVLPLIVQGGLWLIETVLEKTQVKTQAKTGG